MQQGGSIPVVFRGPYQRGDGLGGLFKGLVRVARPIFKSVIKAATPLAKRAGKALAKQAMNTGMEIARDVSKGENWRTSTRKRLAQGADDLAALAGTSLRDMTGGAHEQRLTPTLAARMLHSRQVGANRGGASRKRKANPIKKSLGPLKRKKIKTRAPQLRYVI
jgi:hypothetical protein